MFLMPLYTYPTEEQERLGLEREPNLSHDFTEEAAASVELDFISTGPGDLETTFGPEDVFHYIYSVLHSPEYRRRYADFLKSDFPRVPLRPIGRCLRLWFALVKALASLHLMESEGDNLPAFPKVGDNRVDKVRLRAAKQRSPRPGVHQP